MVIKLFTWGYYGWGNATPQLVQVVDAVETGRGFRPPIFIDIRIRRAVRAKGFQGSAFEKMLGTDRHRSMKSLGNRYIETHSGPEVQIADPATAEELLDLGIEAAQSRQRLLFFCSCQYPRHEGKLACHRDTVATLVLESARRRHLQIEIIEWPGGEPQEIYLEVTPEIIKALERGRVTIPLGASPDLRRLGGLPWGSVVTVRGNDQRMQVLAGPATYQRGEWLLPVFGYFPDPDTEVGEIKEAADNLRTSWGLNRRQSPGS